MARPVAAGVVTILGGLFITAGGAILALIGGILAAIFHIFSGFFVLGLVLGFLIFLFGLLMIAVPAGHTVWGIVVIVFALVSIPFSFAGFIIGFILAILGGILAIVWHPPPPSPAITVSARVVSPPPH
ncbi:MAG: DUF6114 domain-containing protein [Thermoplasmata archaeon]|jgi:hypothetical protein